jgi:hypothetical protein
MSSRHGVWHLRALWLAPALALVACGELDPAQEAATAAIARPGGGPVTVDDAGELVPGQLIAKLAMPIAAGSPLEVGGQVLTPIEELADGAWLMAIEPGDVIAARDVRTPAQRTRDAVSAVGADPGVVYAHGNDIMRFSWQPNDTYYARQWNYPQIGLPSAWDVTRGQSTVRIAIFDSGKTVNPEHPDLQGATPTGSISSTAAARSTWGHGIAGRMSRGSSARSPTTPRAARASVRAAR